MRPLVPGPSTLAVCMSCRGQRGSSVTQVQLSWAACVRQAWRHGVRWAGQQGVQWAFLAAGVHQAGPLAVAWDAAHVASSSTVHMKQLADKAALHTGSLVQCSVVQAPHLKDCRGQVRHRLLF